MNEADVSVVVVDSGSWKTRVGIAGEASPRAEMTSVVGNHLQNFFLYAFGNLG